MVDSKGVIHKLTIQVAGIGSDFTQDINTIVRDFLYTNWDNTISTLTKPTTVDGNNGDLRFGIDWWDGYGDIQIHCRDARDVTEYISTGWNYQEVKTYIELHLFVRAHAEQRNSTVFKVVREIKRILLEHSTTVGSGVRTIKIAPGRDFIDVTGKDAEEYIWHYVATVELLYHMIKT